MTDLQWAHLLVTMMANCVDMVSLEQATASEATRARLDNIEGRLFLMSEVMGNVQEAIAAINQETNNLAERITGLQTRIQNAPTVEEAVAAAGQLGQIAGRLRSLAAVEGNPVPGGVVPPEDNLPAEV